MKGQKKNGVFAYRVRGKHLLVFGFQLLQVCPEFLNIRLQALLVVWMKIITIIIKDGLENVKGRDLKTTLHTFWDVSSVMDALRAPKSDVNTCT